MEINERESSLQLLLAGLVLTAHTPARAPQAGGESQQSSKVDLILGLTSQYKFNCQFKDQAVIEDIFDKIIEI